MGRLHARSYRAVPERYPELRVDPRLVVAADPHEAAREAAVDHLGFAEATAAWREVLARPDVDVVSICAPNHLHREIALAAADAGTPFWIEKPMGVGVADSEAIARAAAARNLVTAVGFNYRHAPAIAHARGLVRSGALGRVTTVRAWLLADYAASPDAPLTWRYERALAGAGVVGDLLSHGADLVQQLVGRITEVTATTSTFIDQRPVPTRLGVGHGGHEVGEELGAVENEDHAAALVRFGSGAVGTLEASRVAHGPRAEYVVEVYGTRGSVRWSFERLNELRVADERGGYRTVMAGPEHGEFARFQPGAGTSMGFDDLKTVEAALFLGSVLTGEQRAPSVADGWAAAAVGEAVVASAADGGWHTVPDVPGTTYDR
ncbi:Gfo/Idh/MocA family oxidoreductase [Actinomycetaceae bacterium Sa1BUA1]|uniref:Gfo/Idh/MocA family oxidoreductase n=2 Tax=Oceanitalea stevensii TaxID=2763072 RepID=A0ABR8Z1U7_9MICO|nr:Gfo/Idh/MocA family oxidoreductase [Oceanitalea stevensii]